MYIDNAEIESELEEDYSNNDNKKSLIVKIIIMAICLIVLIWLIIALKNANNNKKTVYDPMVHANNIEEVRLASEKYFFINKNLPQINGTKTITLKALKDEKMIQDIVDYNKKVCNDESTSSLTDDGNTYILRINLTCSTNENEEVFYYDKKTMACLNCNGKTLMTEQMANDNYDNVIIYNCNTWSNWSSQKENDLSLEERVRSLYRGVKEGQIVNRISYSEWSEYSKNVVLATDTTEVETKETIESVWSETKTTSNNISDSNTIRIINTDYQNYSYCPSGYKKENDHCISTDAKVGYVSYLDYHNILNAGGSCGSPITTEDFEIVYKCDYYPTVDLKTGTKTIYYYQEMISIPVTYYRFRTKKIEKVAIDTEYTNDYYEEDKIPFGYKKALNTEKLEYSYKLKECEK